MKPVFFFNTSLIFFCLSFMFIFYIMSSLPFFSRPTSTRQHPGERGINPPHRAASCHPNPDNPYPMLLRIEEKSYQIQKRVEMCLSKPEQEKKREKNEQVNAARPWGNETPCRSLEPVKPINPFNPAPSVCHPRWD